MAGTPDERYQAFLSAIRHRVCSVCLDGRDDGTCGLSGRVCAVESHLPGLVEALVRVRSNRMDEYVEALRAQVCSRCDNQDARGRCKLREAGDCALDAYLSLVVDAIEEVQEQEACRAAKKS